MPNNIKLRVKEKISTSIKHVGKAVKRKYITTNFIFLPSKTKRKKKKEKEKEKEKERPLTLANVIKPRPSSMLKCHKYPCFLSLSVK
jgi:hypothetical protein